MRTLEEIKIVVLRIKYKDWRFKVDETNGTPWLQVSFPEQNTVTFAHETFKSGKQILSYHMCDNEIIRTVYQTIKRAMLHEMDERFSYNGQLIFDPHMNYNNLATVLSMIGKDVRND